MRFSIKECGTTFSGNGDSEKIRQSEKYINLKKEILNQVKEGIKNDRRILNKMVKEYTVRFRRGPNKALKKKITL